MQINVNKNYDISGLDVDVRKVAAEIKQFLKPYYGDSVSWYGDAVRIDGNLADFWKRAITDVEIKIKIRDGEMFITAEGKCSLGILPWIAFALGLFLNFFLIWFALNLIEYFLSRELPEKSIKDALENIEFKLKESPEKYILTPESDKQNTKP